MADFPSLKDLLNYGDDYKLNAPIMSDYFIVDPNRKKDDEASLSNQDGESEDALSSEEDNSESNLQSNSSPKESSTNDESSASRGEKCEEGEDDQGEISETDDKKSEEQEESDNNSNDEKINEEDEIDDEELPSQDQEEEASTDEKEDSKGDEGPHQDDAETDKKSNDNNDEEEEDNSFDDLMNNYDEDNKNDKEENKTSKGENHASSKLNDINFSKIYRILKKLVSLSYENYEKGSYKYNKKEVVKHYLTNQKFKIMDDLISPSFKPDIYVFDLSPSNDAYLEMYVNAIGSVAMKKSLIYLTFNERILRKLEIKRNDQRGIDVKEIVNSNITRYPNFDCTVYDEDTTIFDELRLVKDRKIYVFSDFDVRTEMILLSKENPDIVWFSTQNSSHDSLFEYYYETSYHDQYRGYYVETSDIRDIEKYILEKNKSRYRRDYNG